MAIERHKKTLLSAHDHIDPLAIAIIKKLKDAGFDGYLVGGGVRDLLVGLKPKDFDIATNALPQQIKRKVPNSYIIGRRFKLVHAKRGDKIFEVATYRREATLEELQSVDDQDLNYVEENFFGTLEEDSFRRDFTINSLFYDPIDQVLIDHCQGLKDIESKTLRVIGDPIARIKEDPVRILRAIRLSQKLGFQFESELRKAIYEYRSELQKSVIPRRREEWLKILRLPNPEIALWELYDLGVFEMVLPSFQKLWQNEDQVSEFLSFLLRFKNADLDFQDPVELFGAVLYSFLIAKFGYGFKIQEVAENPKFQLFCRDEIGVFKAEVLSIVIAIDFIQTLSRHENYLKKGDRRRKAILNNHHFDLALKLGLISGELSAQDFLFWQNEQIKSKLNHDEKNQFTHDQQDDNSDPDLHKIITSEKKDSTTE